MNTSRNLAINEALEEKIPKIYIVNVLNLTQYTLLPIFTILLKHKAQSNVYIKGNVELE